MSKKNDDAKERINIMLRPSVKKTAKKKAKKVAKKEKKEISLSGFIEIAINDYNAEL
jgi:hypothetical protein